MRKVYSLLLLLFACNIAQGQTVYQWQQIYGGPGIEVGYGVRTCLGQGYIIVGSSASAGPTDGYIIRTDSIGLVMWSKFYGGVNIDVIRSVEILPDSGFIMAGYTNSYGNGGYDGWLIRTDKNGDTLWTRTVGTTDWDFFYDVSCTYDGGFICAGGTYGVGNGDEDMWLVRFNSNGDTLWTKTHGGARQDEARSVIETEDSLLAMCGFTCSLNDTLGDSWVLRMNQNGDTIWTHTYGDYQYEDHANGLTYDSLAGRIIYCGYTMRANGGDGYWRGIYYNNTFWFEDSLHGGLYDEYAAVRCHLDNGRFAVSGTSFSYGGGNGDMYIFGSFPWAFNTFGSTYEDHSFDIDVTNDGGYILVGSTTGFNSIIENVYVVKVDSTYVCAQPVGVSEPAPGPLQLNAYPVPCSNNINLSASSNSITSHDLRIEIIDLMGQVVKVVPESEITVTDPNRALSVVDVTGLTNGVYMYMFYSNDKPIGQGKFIVSH